MVSVSEEEEIRKDREIYIETERNRDGRKIYLNRMQDYS